MKYFTMAKFLKHSNLQISKFNNKINNKTAVTHNNVFHCKHVHLTCVQQTAYSVTYLLIYIVNNDKQVIWAKLMRRATALAVPVCRLSWSISSHFIAIHPGSLHRSWKSQKNTKTPYFGGFKIIDVNTAKKLVTSVTHDKQHIYAYLQLFSR